jgi:hypothetical protein
MMCTRAWWIRVIGVVVVGLSSATSASRGGRYYVIAEHGERARWVQNLRTRPEVVVRVARRRFRDCN